MMPVKAARRAKDSGISWVGAVPEHWGVKRAKFLFNLAKRPPGDEDGIVTAFRDGQVTLRSNRRTDGFTNAIKESGYQGVRKGDLVIHAMDAFAGAIGVSESDGKCTPVYSCCIPNEGVSSNYYALCVRTMATTGFVESLAKGIRERSTDFRWAMFAEQLLPVPPSSEQSAIVAYLNSATARIDTLVAKKSRFIELLREKRQALITHAVTKGLDPSVAMKDSGVEWLGKVPAHWVTNRLAMVFREVVRTGHPDIPVLSISIHDGISDDELDEAERNRKVTHIEDRSKYKRVAPGDLAYNMMRAWQGAFGAVNVIGQVSPAYVVAEPKISINTSYVELLLRTPMAIEEMRRFSRGIADFRSRLYWEHFRDVRICLPPFGEQEKILSEIASSTSRINTLIARTERSIELLREYRTALITAAVSGKIDLREPAPQPA